MRLNLPYPFRVSSRLLPSVVVGDAEISIEHRGCDDNGTPVFRVTLDLATGESFTNGDLTGWHGATIVDAMAAFLAFLEGAGEGDPEEVALFPETVSDWAAEVLDEISIALVEVAHCEPDDETWLEVPRCG